MNSFLSRNIRFGIVLAGACLCSVGVQAQASSVNTVPTMPGAPPAFGHAAPTEDAARSAKMARERNAIRQKQLVEDTNRLLDLAKQLKASVDKSSRNELSLDVVKKAAEIEKLAKQVEKKMRTEDGVPDK